MIGSILHCIRSCFDNDDDDHQQQQQLRTTPQRRQQQQQQQSHYDPPRPSFISRSIRGPRIANFSEQEPTSSDTMLATETVEFQTRDDDESSFGDSTCCRPEPILSPPDPQQQQPSPSFSHATANTTTTTSSTTTTTASRRKPPKRLFWFWRRASHYEQVDQLEDEDTISTVRGVVMTSTTTKRAAGGGDKHFLKTASTFQTAHEIPSISSQEIVLPGSDLQQQMAKKMAEALKQQAKGDNPTSDDVDYEDECVICMEAFTPENPRMPTMCGCGENKTSFHLPCLYQWMDQSNHQCPSCRQTLVWEEF